MSIALTRAERQKLIISGVISIAPEPTHWRVHKEHGPKSCTPHDKNQNSPPANAIMIDGKWISTRWLKKQGRL